MNIPFFIDRPAEGLNRRKIMELLAPAGTMSHIRAAIEGGADAVYLGGTSFSARRYADNFTEETMREAVRLCHLYGVSVYVTVNILIGDHEMEELEKYLLFLRSLAVDGLIMQDLGAAAAARRLVPEIPLHASTQMTVSDTAGAAFLKRLHFTRVVLARELSSEEISRVSRSCGMETEIFVHGALCVCYSGQCLMSSMIGGRSGNRGACAQPCRLPYELTDQEGHGLNGEKGRYIISPKDMMTLDRISRIAASGAVSLKIEGRMKSASYVYETVRAYRKALDEAGRGSSVSAEEYLRPVEKNFNRGYTHAYLDDRISGRMMTGEAPGNRGIPAGQAEITGRGSFSFRSSEKLVPGTLEGISYVTSRGELAFLPPHAVRPDGSGNGYRALYEKKPREHGTVYLHIRQKNRAFEKSEMNRRIPVSAFLRIAEGEPLCLTLADERGHRVSTVSDYRAQKADRHAAGLQETAEQLGRLGQTCFRLIRTEAENPGCLIPKSVLNRLRQEASEKLEEAIVRDFEEKHRQKTEIPGSGGDVFPGRASGMKSFSGDWELAARVENLEQAEEAAAGGVSRILFGGDSFRHESKTLGEYGAVADFCRSAGIRVTFCMPRIMREKDRLFWKNRFFHLADMEPDSLSAESAGTALWAEESEKKPVLEGGSSLNIFNARSAEVLARHGFSFFMLSSELTAGQIRRLLQKASIPAGVWVRGRTEMMVSEYCVIQAVLTDTDKQRCPAPCRRGRYFLKDRQGRSFPVVTDQQCRMHILNSDVLDMAPYLPSLRESGIFRFSMDLRAEEGDIEKLCRLYADVLRGKAAPPPAGGRSQDMTRGHFFRGVL
jgi:putative protease